MLRPRLLLWIAICLLGALTLPACNSRKPAQADVTAWLDEAHKTAVEQYWRAYPDRKDLAHFEIVDPGQIIARLQEFDAAGKGWPDIIVTEPGVVMAAADPKRNFPLDLNDWIDQSDLDGFIPNALAACYSPDRKLLCLREDATPNILWYNKPLMEQFGYSLPATWEEYQALSDRLAAEHPGYIMGTPGVEPAIYFWASGCPVAHPLSPTRVVINTSDVKCRRVADLIDHMLQNGTLSRDGPFDARYVELANENKILMMPGAAWMGDYVFGGKPDSAYYHTAERQLAAALLPRWEGEAKAYTGSWGGAAWMVSRRTQNPALAVEIIWYMATDVERGRASNLMPAYSQAAEAWAARWNDNPLYALNPAGIVREAVSLAHPDYTAAVRYNLSEGFAPFLEALEQGQPVAPTLEAVQARLKSLAEAEGYEVVLQP